MVRTMNVVRHVYLKGTVGISLAVQWLRLGLPVQGAAGLIPGRRAKNPHAWNSKN